MIGMEFKFILGLVILLAFLAIVFIMIFNPATKFSQNTGTQMSFRDFCVFWSLGGYKEGIDETVITRSDGKPHGTPSDFCPSVVGPVPPSGVDDYLERCKNVCRGLA